MVRQARKESPTGYYHIMMRGNNRENIFQTADQKKYFLKLINEQKGDLIVIVAYCVMDNHVHLIIHSEKNNLAEALKRINIKYAMKYNYMNNRVGHVFQDRYRSEIITNDVYLNQVIRYVHNNPLKARLVETIKAYSWSSYSEYTDNIKLVDKEQKEFVLKQFHKNTKLFEEFHMITDNNEYLDTKEEIHRNRLHYAEEIIAEYCEDKGVFDSKQITSKPEFLEELIIRILTKTKLSHREIARLLEINVNAVHKTNINNSNL